MDQQDKQMNLKMIIIVLLGIVAVGGVALTYQLVYVPQREATIQRHNADVARQEAAVTREKASVLNQEDINEAITAGKERLDIWVNEVRRKLPDMNIRYTLLPAAASTNGDALKGLQYVSSEQKEYDNFPGKKCILVRAVTVTRNERSTLRPKAIFMVKPNGGPTLTPGWQVIAASNYPELKTTSATESRNKIRKHVLVLYNSD